MTFDDPPVVDPDIKRKGMADGLADVS